jgi:hypothetical protein
MNLALYVERIPTLTVEGEHLCVVVEISDAEAVALLETLRLLVTQIPDTTPTP